MDLHDAQAEVEVVAKTALTHQGGQIPMRRSDEPDVHAPRSGRSDAPYLPVLEHAQQARLGVRWQLADLVQKQGASVGGLHQSLLRPHRPGERALLVAEELVLDEPTGNRGAVDRDHGRVAALTLLVQRPRHQLLACSGLAQYEHRRIRGSHLVDAREHIPHDLATPDHARDGVAACDVRFECLVLTLQAMMLEDAVHAQQHLVVVERLRDVVDGAELHGFHRRAHARVARDHQDGEPRILGDDVRPRGAGQTHVGDHEIDAIVLQQRPRRLHRLGLGDLVAVAREQPAHRRPNHDLVFDDEDAAHDGDMLPPAAAAWPAACNERGRFNETVAPSPGELSMAMLPPWSCTIR